MMKAIKLLAVCLVAQAIFFLHADTLRLWFDESVQLSSAHSSHPERLEAYRYEVDPVKAISYNQRYNMDPGGYTLFLNLMSPFVRNNFHFYRLINISAFILGLSLVIRGVAHRFGGSVSKVDALLFSSLYLLLVNFILQVTESTPRYGFLMKWPPFAVIMKSGFSIRAYGFEFLSVCILLYSLDWRRALSANRMIPLASVMFLGLTFRYDYALFVFSFLAAVFFDAYRGRELKRLLVSHQTWFVMSVVVLGLLLVLWLGYVPQMGGLHGPMKMGYLGGYYLNNSFKIVQALKDPVNLVALTLLLYSLWRMLLGKNTFLEVLYAILFMTHIALSLKGYYPLHMGLDRCLSIVVTFHLLFVEKFVEALRFLVRRFRHGDASSRSLGRYLVVSLTLLGSVVSVGVLWRAFEKYGERPFMSAMTSIHDRCFDSIMSRLTGASVVIDRAATPNINAYYHFRGKPMPANEYFCDQAGPHSRQTDPPTVEERCGVVLGRSFDYYVVPELHNNRALKSYLEGPEFEKISCTPGLSYKEFQKSDVFRGRYPFYRRNRAPNHTEQVR